MYLLNNRPIDINGFIAANTAPNVEPLSRSDIKAIHWMNDGDVIHFGGGAAELFELRKVRTFDYLMSRYPNVLALIIWQASLNPYEAISALESYLVGRSCGVEAVAHYGGPEAILSDAMRNRNLFGARIRK